MYSIGDDRLDHVVRFISERLDHHKKQASSDSGSTSPLIIGLNGIQGCGKSTLVEQLQQKLSSPPWSMHIVVFSIDDLYLPHKVQLALAQSHPTNPLVQHRGQPSTHDVELGKDILQALRANHSVDIPMYDKSAFNGQGDRLTERAVHVDTTQRKVDLVILEGWFIGFRSLPESVAWEKWQHAEDLRVAVDYTYEGRLGHNSWQSIQFVNSELKRYDVLTNQFDALIHIDAEDPLYVYEWRLEAERKLRERTGSGMTDEQVKTFVDGYYPSYELYTDELRKGTFASDAGRQLRLVVGKDRRVKEVVRL